ncbi:MAG: aminotransferase class I/II-fold pyridoxal phosphate-dependent enzyme [Polyangiales bacterium]
MTRSERSSFSHTRKLENIERHVAAAQSADAIFHTGRGSNGRYLSLDQGAFLNFGSCSYLALEQLPALTDQARRALDQYGTQFHFSRAYVQCPLYQELEALLEQIAGRPVVVASSTSLAHLAALPVLVRDSDRIIIDQFAHASLHTAVQLVPNVPLTTLRHNRMDQLDTQLSRLRDHRGLVWYVADGLYSMLGDFAAFEELKQLLDKYDNLRLYIDDAHATSWIGRHGRGLALEHFATDERVVVALSLNKAFSAAGGALAVPDRELANRIRRCGGPMMFSGPIQPPMLGAAVGSARLHVSPELARLQSELDARLDACVASIADRKLERTTTDRSPIFQVQCDSPRVALRVFDLMKQRGYFCCVCLFPAVPMNRPGLRFTITRHNHPDDIAPFLDALEESMFDAKREAVVAEHSAPALNS